MGIFGSDTYNYTTEVTREVNTYVTHGTKNVNVVEKKAPTDDSVRLFNEIQEKAVESLINRIKIEDNYLRASAIFLRDNAYLQYVIVVRYTYNKHERTVKYSFDEFDKKKGIQALIEGLIKAVSDDIAQVIVQSSIGEIYHDFIGAVNE